MPFPNIFNLRGNSDRNNASNNAAQNSSEATNTRDSDQDTFLTNVVLGPTEIVADGKGFRIVLFPHMDPSRTSKPHHFEPVEKEMDENVIIKLGRPVKDKSKPEEESTGMTERDYKNGKTIEHVWFKSKVVSRTHAEIWSKDGQLYIKDTSSSSGTFLNRLRLSPSGKESRPYPLKDGDVIQLGIDYQGRAEDIYKSVNIKVHIASEGETDHKRRKANPARFQQCLRALLTTTNPYASSSSEPTSGPNSRVDCCICISPIAPYQAIFLSPCSHCYHYKCIQQLLEKGYMFQCPMCRQVANLNASVSMDSLDELAFDSSDETLSRPIKTSKSEVSEDERALSPSKTVIPDTTVMDDVVMSSPSQEDASRVMVTSDTEGSSDNEREEGEAMPDMPEDSLTQSHIGDTMMLDTTVAASSTHRPSAELSPTTVIGSNTSHRLDQIVEPKLTTPVHDSNESLGRSAHRLPDLNREQPSTLEEKFLQLIKHMPSGVVLMCDKDIEQITQALSGRGVDSSE